MEKEGLKSLVRLILQFREEETYWFNQCKTFLHNVNEKMQTNNQSNIRHKDFRAPPPPHPTLSVTLMVLPPPMDS